MRPIGNSEWNAGYEAGVMEATDDRWTREAAERYVAECPARNDWERGYEAGVMAATAAHDTRPTHDAYRCIRCHRPARRGERTCCGVGMEVVPIGAELAPRAPGLVATWNDA